MLFSVQVILIVTCLISGFGGSYSAIVLLAEFGVGNFERSALHGASISTSAPMVMDTKRVFLNCSTSHLAISEAID